MISFRNRSRGIQLLALTAGPAALLLALLVTLAALSGCGGKEEQAPTPLTFEELSDTARARSCVPRSNRTQHHPRGRA